MAAAAAASALLDLVVGTRARTADEQLRDMCAKMDAAFEARQKADPTSTPFLVYLVRNGFERGTFDRLGCLYTSRDDAVAQLSDVCAAESDTPQAGHDYMDVHVADLRTDASKICELLVDVDHHDIRVLLRDAEVRQQSRDRARTAAEKLHDMCAKMDAAFEARQKADPTCTPFLVYLVRNGVDHKGGLHPTRELAVDAIGRRGVFLAEAFGFKFDANYECFDIYVADVRTDAAKIHTLLATVSDDDIHALLRDAEARQQRDRARTAAEQLRDMCVKMDVAFAARQKADPTSTPFLAYVVRNGFNVRVGAFDRLGGLYTHRDDAVEFLRGVCKAEANGLDVNALRAGNDYFDVHVVDLRTDADRVCQLITDTSASEIHELLCKIEERKQADALAAQVAKVTIE